MWIVNSGGHDMAHTPKNAPFLGGEIPEDDHPRFTFFLIPVIQVRVFATQEFLAGISHLGVTPGQFGTILALEVRMMIR